jgi:lysophospholipase L1-like esterase
MSDHQESSLQTASPNPRRRITLKRRLVYVSIIYFSFLLLLVAVEVGTRLRMDHVSSLDLFVVARQQKAQVADEKQSGIFEGDPLLLWRLKPNLDKAVWDYTVLSTNSEHLRSERTGGTLGPKQSGTIRIVCLGDSVTFGFRVPVVWPDKPTEFDPEWLPFPMLLEKQLRAANPDRRIEVITMAVPGYTSHQGLAWLQRDIDNLQPDLLTVSFGWNDASLSDVPDRESIRTNWNSVAVRWLIDHSQAFAHATHWLRTREANKQLQDQRQLQSGPSTTERPPAYAGGSDKPRPAARVSQQEYLANMLAIESLGRGHGAAVIMIAAPYRDYSTEAPEAELMLQYRAALKSTVGRRGIPFLEIRELTEEAYPSNEGWFGERIHPNHMGHRLMASELLKLIQTKRLLPELTIPELIP